MRNIQLYESVFLESVLQYKYLFILPYEHYRAKSYLKYMPADRPNKRLTSFLDNDCRTFFDRLCEFVFG